MRIYSLYMLCGLCFVSRVRNKFELSQLAWFNWSLLYYLSRNQNIWWENKNLISHFDFKSHTVTGSNIINFFCCVSISWVCLKIFCCFSW